MIKTEILAREFVFYIAKQYWKIPIKRIWYRIKNSDALHKTVVMRLFLVELFIYAYTGMAKTGKGS